MSRPFRWFQFSIRGVLTLTLCVACFFSGWAAREWRYEKEREEAAASADSAAVDEALAPDEGCEYPPFDLGEAP